jgi:hypothetical protein
MHGGGLEWARESVMGLKGSQPELVRAAPIDCEEERSWSGWVEWYVSWYLGLHYPDPFLGLLQEAARLRPVIDGQVIFWG